MRFDIITAFPGAFVSYFSTSILKRAHERKLISIFLHDLRKRGKGKHHQLDDKPYGGGAGMVLMAEPILKTASEILKRGARGAKTVILSAKGKQFNQRLAYEWAKKYKRLVLISGRYEGIDERVKTALKAEEISIGPYVLTDGDSAAMVIVSAVTRLIPGVIRLESLKEESHLGRGTEYPHYTRPEVLKYKSKTYRVPKVLLSGDHKEIARWRSRHRK